MTSGQSSRDVKYLMDQLKIIDEIPDFSSDDGFILLASSMFLIITQLTSNVNLTEVDIENAITDAHWGIKNRRGDKGVDSYFIDDEDKTIHMFQSKYLTQNNPAKSSEEALAFLKAPEVLMTLKSVDEYINDSIVELVREFADKVFENNYKIHLHFVTTSSAQGSAKEVYTKWEEQPLEISIGDIVYSPKHQATLWDYDAILNLWESYNGKNPIDVNLAINPNRSFKLVDKNSRMLITSLKVTELMRIFKDWGYDLFRENPRGPLGKLNVNANIEQTIKDTEKKDLFHILNNGISVVCKTIQFTEFDNYFSTINPLNEEKDSEISIRIEDFQIVNGLQTTFTLNRLNPPMNKYFYDNTYVIMKISEAPTIRNEIAITSNSQNSITGWDFVSQNQTHKRLQKGINDNNNYGFGVFYEIRRGEKDHIIKGAGRGITKLQPKLLTQSLLAFNGDPVLAKDQIRLVSAEVTENKGKFAELYTDQINEFHAMLAYKCWLYVNDKVKDYAKRHETHSDPRLDWMSYARFHIVALIGHGILTDLDTESIINIPAENIEETYNNREEKFEIYYNQALETIEYEYDMNKEIAERDGRQYNNRQQFKTQENWKKYLDRFITRIRRGNEK